MPSPVGQVSEKSACETKHAMGDANLGDLSLSFYLSKKPLGNGPTRDDVPARQVPERLAIHCGEALSRMYSSLGDFAGCIECGFGLIVRPALCPQHGLSVVDLQLESPNPPRRLRLHDVSFGERREQRLRFGYGWKQRRRRKAFEGGGERVIGFHGSAGRSQKLRQRERGSQAERA